jgi:hypothetical protein
LVRVPREGLIEFTDSMWVWGNPTQRFATRESSSSTSRVPGNPQLVRRDCAKSGSTGSICSRVRSSSRIRFGFRTGTFTLRRFSARARQTWGRSEFDQRRLRLAERQKLSPPRSVNPIREGRTSNANRCPISHFPARPSQSPKAEPGVLAVQMPTLGADERRQSCKGGSD